MSLALAWPVAVSAQSGMGDFSDVRRALEASRVQDEVPFSDLAASHRVEGAAQVRVEQRSTIIRVIPRQPTESLRFNGNNANAKAPRRVRSAGNCVPIQGIAGVQVDPENRLLFLMRDQRVLSAMLERSCQSRDYYSGFYLAPTADGMLCVNRDRLRSRNGANCRVAQLSRVEG